MQGPNPPLTAILHSIHILRIGDVYTVFFDWMETMKFIRFPLEIIANGALLVWGVFSLSLCQQWDSSSCIHKAVSQNQHETQQKEQLMLDKGALKSIADPNWIIQVLYNTESVRVEFNSPIIDSVLMESCLALSPPFFSAQNLSQLLFPPAGKSSLWREGWFWVGKQAAKTRNKSALLLSLIFCLKSQPPQTVFHVENDWSFWQVACFSLPLILKNWCFYQWK